MRTHIRIGLSAGRNPIVHETAWIAPGAVIVGAVTLGPGSSVWYNAVLRGDSNGITIGPGSNLQDGVVVHVDSHSPATIGEGVSVGHNAVIHGATIGDHCLIGMNATVLSGAVIGEGSLVAAGALVPQGRTIPPGSLVAGVPASVIRPLTAEEQESIRENAQKYLTHTQDHANALKMQ